MKSGDKIYVAGHRGMVGSAIVRELQRRGFTNIVCRSSAELDLRDQAAVNHFFETEEPDYVFMAAAKVDGIWANNTYRAEFIYDNLAMETNVIHAAYKYGVTKLLFLGSSCIYPKAAPQPLKEEYLLTGPLEATNEPYAIAKIAGIKLCEAYRDQYGANFFSVVPAEVYGIGDNYDSKFSAVVPALIRSFYEAKRRRKAEVVVLGTGEAMREFLYADDLADACLFLMQEYEGCEVVNIGTGENLAIADLAQTIKDITGYDGGIAWDTSKPNGSFHKILDITKLYAMGWKHHISFKEGIQRVCNDFLKLQFTTKSIAS